MSESRPSLYPRFTWILLAVLIGVGALGQWYIRGLHQKLTAQEARISEQTQQLADTDRWLKTATQSEQELRTQLAAAQTQLASTTELHGAAAAKVAQYQQEIAAASAREQELKGRVDSEPDRLKQALAEANAKWNEKVKVYRVALEGNEPQRAALITGLEQQATAAQTALEQAVEQCGAARAQAAQERTEAEAKLTDQLALAQHQVDEDAQALAADAAAKTAQDGLLAEAAGKVLALTEELQTERSALAEQQQKYEQALAAKRTELDQAGQTLAGVQGELSSTVAARQVQDEQLKTAEQRIATLEQDLKAAAARAEDALAAAQRAADEARAETQQQLEQVRAEAEQAKQALTAHSAAKSAAATPSTGPLSARYPGLKAHQTERGTLISLGDDQLHFRAALLPKGKIPSLERLAALLAEHPNLSVRIEGYTDSSGEDDTNLALSKARADAVRQALIDHGVAPERVTAEGFGKQRPIADNATPADRRKNRRIEVYLIEPAP